MDKYEYKLKLEQIKNLVDVEDYSTAAEIADTINWKKVRNANTLCMVATIYENIEKYDECQAVLMQAYEHASASRSIVSKMVDIAIKARNVEDAEEFYSEFVELSPKNSMRYVYAYQIACMKGSPISDRIAILEELKNREYTEVWAYELAALYGQAEMRDKCVETCDELVLWFGEGDYVEKALNLKRQFQPLTPVQEKKYQALREKRGLRDIDLPKKTEVKISESSGLPEVEVTVSASKFNTVNLQEELAKSMRQIMDATEKETVSDTMQSIKKMVSDIPYLNGEQEGEKISPTFDRGAINEVVDESLKADFQDQMEKAAVQTEDKKVNNDQIKGQMSIEDVLAEWEKTKRAAEAAIAAAEQKKLEMAKDQALVEAGEIMERLKTLIPILTAEPEEHLPQDDTIAAAMFAEEKKVEDISTNEDSAIVITASGVNLDEIENGVEVTELDEESDENPDVPETEDTAEAAGEEAAEEAVEEILEAVEEPAAEDVVETAAQEAEEETSEPEDSMADETVESIADEIAQVLDQVEPEENQEETAEDGLTKEIPDISEYRRIQAEEPIQAQGMETLESPKFEDPSKDDSLANFVENVTKGMLENTDLEVPVSGEEVAIPVLVPVEEPNVAPADETEEVEADAETAEETAVEADRAAVEADEAAVEADEAAVATDETAVETDDAATEAEKEDASSEAAEPEQKEEAPKSKYNIPEVFTGELTEEHREMFSYFLPVPGMEEQIVNILGGAKSKIGGSITSLRGNIVVIGEEGSGKTVFATSLIKSIQKLTGREDKKIGKISAESLNRRDFAALIPKMDGGFLIVDKAGDLSKDTILRMSNLMEKNTNGLVVILEDNSAGIRKALKQDYGFAKKFTEKVTIPIFTIDELVQFGKSYAKEMECFIDEMGVLALYNRINNIQKHEHATTLAEVKDIVDEAIESAESGGLKKLFSKKYDENDFLILREKDFEK